MIQKKSSSNPFKTKADYGVVGVTLELNLVQCQKLAQLRTELNKKPEDPTEWDKEISMFLEIFKQFTTDSSDIWENFYPKEEKTESNEL